ncbi:MAG: 60 kDa inner rane insertion protein preprotein translocase subunit YidC [Parcubacteria group bacterium]|nr:60 kDa inner rane insertion protein preprotein translocase subunit YidC [Parcubacteria group bacterium]
MLAFFHTILYVPIYNLLIFFVDVVPNGDVGIAVIIVTVIVKIIVAPFSISAVKTQRRMKFLEPQMKEIKEKYKDDKEKQAKETFALYKNNGVKPFSSIFASFLQLPIIIALYLVFRHEQLLAPNASLIYHFVSFPTHISPLFLGIFPTTGHVLVLAIIAAAFQFAQAYYTIPVPDKPTKGTAASGTEEFTRALSLQSRFILPVIIGVVAYTAGALALYFITSSIVGIIQEFYVRHQLRNLKMPQAV